MSVSIWKSIISQRLLSSNLNSVEEFRAKFLSAARESLRLLAEGLMNEEVEALSGKAFSRKCGQTGVSRSGSDPATVRIAGQRVRVRKQRLKQNGKEVSLKSYAALKQGDMLTDRVMNCMIAGISTRNYNELLEEVAGGLGLSKSTVSKVFVDGSRKALEHLETRSLQGKLWCALQVDAIHFAERSVIVVLGIESTGRKVILGLREGTTESSQVCIDLLQDLISRGLRTDAPFILVLDGGKGLSKAVREVFGKDFPVQRCMIHKSRNIQEYLPKFQHAEFRRRWAKIRRADRYSDARAEYFSLRKWLEATNTDALKSFDEAGEELLTVAKIGAGHVLRRSLISTNLIESLFARVRTICSRVKSWQPKKGQGPHDQIKRWCAVALLAAERNSSQIHGNAEVVAFIQRLREKTLQTQPQVA